MNTFALSILYHKLLYMSMLFLKISEKFFKNCRKSKSILQKPEIFYNYFSLYY